MPAVFVGYFVAKHESSVAFFPIEESFSVGLQVLTFVYFFAISSSSKHLSCQNEKSEQNEVMG